MPAAKSRIARTTTKKHPPRAAAPSKPRGSSGDTAYRAVHRRIFTGELASGVTYSERDLANLAGVAPASLGPAIQKLAEEGLVERDSRRGIRLLAISADEMIEIYEILIALEPIAVRYLAMQTLRRGELDSLVAAVRQMDTALLTDDRLAWLKADELFHALLLRLCANRRLAEAISAYSTQMHRFRMHTLSARPLPVASNRAHAAVVDAVRRGDAEAAFSIHHSHLTQSRSTLMALVRDSRPAGH
jgi:DNA-binding GntR family transcriptional regulator